ncbi:hypothetical protein MSAN_01513200 [Mycena sanguinolenta]|uniref:Uncharacterized protein n=1 Tax=Mycena sanguinolenta TaxID=230812 RepID=A0A8H6Y352_9AGAR|nr:hypothetical protein MSAN_01513200 [Mycena sanguinolenta]
MARDSTPAPGAGNRIPAEVEDAGNIPRVLTLRKKINQKFPESGLMLGGSSGKVALTTVLSSPDTVAPLAHTSLNTFRTTITAGNRMAWSKERREKEAVDSPRLHLQLHLYPHERVHAAVAVRLQAAPLSARPPNRSSSPHLSLRGCSEGGNDHRPTTFGNVATHVCLRTTSSAGPVLATLRRSSGDADQGFYTGKPVF